MSEKTNISFADHTGSPWIGCTKVDTGCIRCYADELDKNRFSKTLGGGTKANPIRHWGRGAPRLRTQGFWKAALNWNNRPWVCETCGKSMTSAQHHTHRHFETPNDFIPKFHRARVFPSLCDWLDEEVPIEWFCDFLKVVYETPNLDWMLFTKRPENFQERFRQARVHAAINGIGACADWLWNWIEGKAPKNVWVFASAGCQDTYNKMIDPLMCIPALVRGISCEPMTGAIDFGFTEQVCVGGGSIPDVVIFGGESGPGARPCNIHWIEDGIEQCEDEGILPYVKQLGSNPVIDGCEGEMSVHFKHPKGGDPSEWPEHLRLRQLPEEVIR